jgi:hypothetical protein
MPHSGTIHDQLAVIKYKNSYYSLSLRMMKAIYRHVRLYKGFKNMENVNGVIKQRIPELLLREKIRTQSRFDVFLTPPDFFLKPFIRISSFIIQLIIS